MPVHRNHGAVGYDHLFEPAVAKHPDHPGHGPPGVDDPTGDGHAEAIKREPGASQAPLRPGDLPVQRVSRLRRWIVQALLRRFPPAGGSSNSIDGASQLTAGTSIAAVVASDK